MHDLPTIRMPESRGCRKSDGLSSHSMVSAWGLGRQRLNSCICTVQDFHVPSFPNSVAGGIYSHMLSQIDTQWYHTRRSQQFQVLFSWRQKLEIKYLEKSRSFNILWKGFAFSYHKIFCCLYCPEVMKIYQNTEYSNNVGLGLTSPWKPCVL